MPLRRPSPKGKRPCWTRLSIRGNWPDPAGILPQTGRHRPITGQPLQPERRLFVLGFEVFAEDEITSRQYAFDHLNFPPEHPARDSMDTYWLKGSRGQDRRAAPLLRPHLAGGSVLQPKHRRPRRFVYPGPAAGTKARTPGMSAPFSQYEALIVGKNFAFYGPAVGAHHP